MQNAVIEYLEKQTVAGIACLDENGLPYCFSCFYAFDHSKQILVFKSSVDSRHSTMLENHPELAGTVNPDKLNKLAIKGIQFKGMIDTDPKTISQGRDLYYKRFPFAVAMKGDVWVIRLSWIKMTDQALGFGKKMEWERTERGTETETGRERERERERVIP